MTDGSDPALTPLTGGHSGETFLSSALESAPGLPGESTVVRVYAGRGARRGLEAPATDAAVLRLVRGLVPVPEVLEVKRPRPAADLPGLLVTSFLPGTRLDLLLPQLDDPARRTLGTQLGVLLGRLAGMPMPRRGLFLDADLRLGPLPGGELLDLVASARTGTALATWTPTLFAALERVSADAGDLLDGVHRSCLVHGDMNPKNLLVDPRTLEVTGVVDWEFAHSGVPGADLGNLLRFERDPVLTEAVLEAYRAGVPDADDDVLDRARAADLVALVDLAGRRGENPVADRAHDLLVAVAHSGRLSG